jgi:Fur family peroxide stress response transcriptional regulator
VVNANQILQQAGIVTTQQRIGLLELLLRRNDHPDAERVLVAARKRMPSLSADTVYRTLNLFADAGVIQRMAMPTRRARFDGCSEPHDHFLCVQCERIQDLPRRADATRAVPEEANACGEVRDIQTVYVGVCQRCAKRGAGAGTVSRVPLANE